MILLVTSYWFETLSLTKGKKNVLTVFEKELPSRTGVTMVSCYFY